MEYVLKQFYFDGKTLKNWMIPITTDVKTIKIKNDYYTDIGLQMNKTIVKNNISITGFDVNSSYYCACYVYGKNNIQVKLTTTIEPVKGEDYYEPLAENQNIATIHTENSDEWHLVDFVFTPQDIGFNTIYCEYKSRDKDTLNFIPKIVFLELSEIQNLKNSEIDNHLYRKIGVQSRPGLRMLINSEEIRVGRTGIYELKNSDIKIESLGMIQMAQEWKPSTETENLKIEDIKTQLQELTDDYINDKKFNYIEMVIPNREFYSFVLDYIYEIESAETDKQLKEA